MAGQYVFEIYVDFLSGCQTAETWKLQNHVTSKKIMIPPLWFKSIATSEIEELGEPEAWNKYHLYLGSAFLSFYGARAKITTPYPLVIQHSYWNRPIHNWLTKNGDFPSFFLCLEANPGETTLTQADPGNPSWPRTAAVILGRQQSSRNSETPEGFKVRWSEGRCEMLRRFSKSFGMVDGKPWKSPIDFRDILFEILRGHELFWDVWIKKKQIDDRFMWLLLLEAPL